MPPPVSADRSAAQPPPVDALIFQTRRLKGEVDAVRRGTTGSGSDPEDRWQRALYDLALHQLNDLDEHLAQLRDGLPDGPGPSEAAAGPAVPAVVADEEHSLLGRVGSAEWNLLTDGAAWSVELYRILGRDLAGPPLTLDELPSVVVEEDRRRLTAMVTDCLVDGKPIDGEFGVVRPDGQVRTVHMMGEPVLDADGGTAAMWAVLRDVSALRRARRTVSETRDSLRHHRGRTRPALTGGTLQVAVHLPASSGTAAGEPLDACRSWSDALQLPGGDTLLSVGDLAGPGPAGPGGPAMLLGAVRGMALAGAAPGPLMTRLADLLDAGAEPSPVHAVCCRYDPRTRTLTWAGAGRPAPLLFRDGTGRPLRARAGTLPDRAPGTPGGQAPYSRTPYTREPYEPAPYERAAFNRTPYEQAPYEQGEEPLHHGDTLLLHTGGPAGTGLALETLAPLLAGADGAEECAGVLRTRLADDDSCCFVVARVR